MHNIKTIFDRILKMIHEYLSDTLNENGNILRPGPRPKFSDASIMALSLTSEILSIDSENLLFMKLRAEYQHEFSTLIDRTGYNVRRRKLFPYLERLRQHWVHNLTFGESIFMVDSMPLPVCKLSRASRSKICKESFERAPDVGFCAAQQTYFHGYKLHGLCTLEGVFTSVDITKASLHDIHYLKNVKERITHAVLLGDKGYLSEEIRLDLFTTAQIHLQTPMRSNQQRFKPQSPILRKTRKRIETLFSQLCDQFMIQRNYAKSFEGFKNRILTKITALTLSQLINRLNHKPLNNIKYAFA